MRSPPTSARPVAPMDACLAGSRGFASALRRPLQAPAYESAKAGVSAGPSSRFKMRLRCFLVWRTSRKSRALWVAAFRFSGLSLPTRPCRRR